MDPVRIIRAGGGAALTHRVPLAQPGSSAVVAALPDVLLHALLCQPPLESLVMVESAHNRGDIDVGFLLGHLADKPGWSSG